MIMLIPNVYVLDGVGTAQLLILTFMSYLSIRLSNLEIAIIGTYILATTMLQATEKLFAA